VVVLEKAALSAAPIPSDVGTLALIAPPDFALYGGGNMPRSVGRFSRCARRRDRGASTTLQVLQEQRQGAIAWWIVVDAPTPERARSERCARSVSLSPDNRCHHRTLTAATTCRRDPSAADPDYAVGVGLDPAKSQLNPLLSAATLSGIVASTAWGRLASHGEAVRCSPRPATDRIARQLLSRRWRPCARAGQV